jgi:methionine-rich copper-binding protein CopC
MILNRTAFTWCFVLAIMTIATTLAHMRIEKTMPEAGAVLSESPHHIQVWYTQAPDPAISKLTLESKNGVVVLGDTTVQADKSLVALLPSSLPSGTYTVKWRAAGDDGHAQRGDFSFTIQTAER